MDYDRIRDRELNRHLDAKYDSDTRGMAEIMDEHIRRERGEAADRLQRRKDMLAELIDVRSCLGKGTLDYLAACGVLTEYLDDLIALVEDVK